MPSKPPTHQKPGSSPRHLSLPAQALPKKAALTIGIAVLAAAAFIAGWQAAPNHRGYVLGNEDGYAAGYHDGRNGAAPDLHRFMTEGN